MYSSGVVIGKFYPPHKGHALLIDTAASQVEHLTVLVCEAPGQAIPGPLRAAWIREIHPAVEVMVIDDRYDAQDSRVWAENTIRWLGRAPDAVFTSEDYGDRYAELMGAAHIPVDKARIQVPCSGTAVRADPFSMWEYLEPCVRAYFVRRICLVGAESTGKTTLAAALADHYATVWVPEYGREYTDSRAHRDADDPWSSGEFTQIAAEQSRREDRAAREANRLLVCDTDAFATAIWHERYMGAASPEVEAPAAGRRYALYIVTDVDIPWVDDGTRDGAHIRDWMHRRFIDALDERGCPYLVVSGSRDERLAQAVRAIDSLPLPSVETLLPLREGT